MSLRRNGSEGSILVCGDCCATNDGVPNGCIGCENDENIGWLGAETGWGCICAENPENWGAGWSCGAGATGAGCENIGCGAAAPFPNGCCVPKGFAVAVDVKGWNWLGAEAWVVSADRVLPNPNGFSAALVVTGFLLRE